MGRSASGPGVDTAGPRRLTEAALPGIRLCIIPSALRLGFTVEELVRVVVATVAGAAVHSLLTLVGAPAPAAVEPTAIIPFVTSTAAAAPLAPAAAAVLRRRPRRRLIEVHIKLVILVNPTPRDDTNSTFLDVDTSPHRARRRLLCEDAVLPEQVHIAPEGVRRPVRHGEREHHIRV